MRSSLEFIPGLSTFRLFHTSRFNSFFPFIMPRFSKRKRVLRHLAEACRERARYAIQRLLLDVNDDDEDLIDLIFLNRFEEANNSRYLSRGSKNRKINIKKCLEEVLHSKWLNDAEFLMEFRVLRTSLIYWWI